MSSKVIHFPGQEGGDNADQLPIDQDITASAIIDLNGVIQSVNSDFTSLLQYSRYELANMRWTDCGHPDEADSEASMIADLLIGTAANAQFPRRLIGKNGMVAYGSLRLSPLRDAKGEPISLFAVFTAFATSGTENRRYLPDSSAGSVDTNHAEAADADRGERTHKDLKSSEGLADPADTPTEELVTLLNHEFRTPLNAIIGFAEMLDRETYGSLGDPHYREYARHIQESGERLLEFLSDMLDLVIGDNAAMRLSDAVIDPQAPVDALLVSAEDDEGVDRVERDTERVSDGTQILADPKVMNRIMSFLVADAIRSSGDGDQVSVTVGESDSDGGGLTYTIVNAGDQPGKASANGPFGRLADVKDGDKLNARLGLPLCKWLVRLHGGDLEVDRSAETGTKVHVRLPESRILRQTSATKSSSTKLAMH